MNALQKARGTVCGALAVAVLSTGLFAGQAQAADVAATPQKENVLLDSGIGAVLGNAVGYLSGANRTVATLIGAAAGAGYAMVKNNQADNPAPAVDTTGMNPAQAAQARVAARQSLLGQAPAQQPAAVANIPNPQVQVLQGGSPLAQGQMVPVQPTPQMPVFTPKKQLPQYEVARMDALDKDAVNKAVEFKRVETNLANLYAGRYQVQERISTHPNDANDRIYLRTVDKQVKNIEAEMGRDAAAYRSSAVAFEGRARALEAEGYDVSRYAGDRQALAEFNNSHGGITYEDLASQSAQANQVVNYASALK